MLRSHASTVIFHVIILILHVIIILLHVNIIIMLAINIHVNIAGEGVYATIQPSLKLKGDFNFGWMDSC